MKYFFGVLLWMPQLVFAWDHVYASYDSLLKESTKDGLVDYRKLKDRPDRLAEFINRAELLRREEFDSTFNPGQKLAFWINMYNAYTLQLVTDHYPVKSIRDIAGWQQPVASLFGKRWTLEEMERAALRQGAGDPKIYLALVRATKGSPGLPDQAYLPDNVNQQLKVTAKWFLNDITRNRLGPDPKNVIRVAALFKWYENDFKRQGKALLDVIQEITGRHYERVPKIKFLDYDWDLNEQPPETSD